MSSPQPHQPLPGIGVFGTSTTVRCLVPILQSCGFQVHALWGRTQAQASDCATDLHIAFHTNKVDEVLLHKHVDLVFIHCPPHLQAPIAAKALGIGKHVICGTPGTPSQLDALRMLHAAQYYPALMSLMCHGLRLLPCFVRMRQLVEDGYVGRVNVCEARVHCGPGSKDRYDWQCDEVMGGGVLHSHGADLIDLTTFLTQQRATKVHGMLRTYTTQTDKINGIRHITADDFCCLQMELESGACATVTVNNHVPGQYSHEVLVCGTKGRLVVRGADLFGQKHEQTREELLYHDTPNILDRQKTGVAESIRADIPIPHMKGLIKLIDSVKDAFRAGAGDKHSWLKDPVSLAATFEDGQYVQTVVDAVRTSSKQRDWVKVKVMSEQPDPNPFLSAAMRRSTFSLT